MCAHVVCNGPEKSGIYEVQGLSNFGRGVADGNLPFYDINCSTNRTAFAFYGC